MKKNGKYRFTLQFPAETDEQIQAGELLERLGNKKSAILVAALYEYLQAHPALQNPECKILINATHSYPPETITELVRKMVEEQMAQNSREVLPGASPTQPDLDVGEMLDNLAGFM